MSNLSTNPYKGVRDFYPRDEFIQQYIFDTWREVSELFGYRQYNASILEPIELYQSKTSDEIISDQTYQLTDRGDRQIVLRPEMTPTVTRMVSAKSRELGYPLRLYSIPNVFRYERPQRGRLREHWQLNCDIFGDDTLSAEIELIQLAVKIMEGFGINQNNFEVRVSSRSLLNSYFDKYNLNENERKDALRLIDCWHKDENARVELAKLLKTNFDLEPDAEINNLISGLQELGVENVTFDRTIARGFNYYTGIVFEVFDKHPDNNRSLFGGGRFDGLSEYFGVDSIPVVGFGMGDVTIQNVLETYDLLPEYVSSTIICLIANSTNTIDKTRKIAEQLRNQGLGIEIDLTLRKLGTAIKHADKRSTPFITVIGENEASSGTLIIKDLKSGKEKKLQVNEVADYIFTDLI